MSFYPAISPFDAGLLRMSDSTEIYWEASGNPTGTAVLYLHGGPGSGLGSGGYRRHFDPARFLIVGIDQRGCGRSCPLAYEALAELHRNTTQALIEDIEAVRAHLRIQAWAVAGVSWGTTLALAYAQAHPAEVLALFLVAVTTTSREEVDWITEGVGRIFPEAWQTFECGAERRPGERIVEAYARRLAGGDRQDRLRASKAWNVWEATHVSLDPERSRDAGKSVDSLATPRGGEDLELNFATLVTRYWSHDAFLPGDRAILGLVPRIAHIPALFIHGRFDVSGPAITPWRLHKAWPSSRLSIVETEGHGGRTSMERMLMALDAFAHAQPR